MRPSVLSTRALNQYRRRDVLAYLGLRYYLENAAARTKRWAQDVAVRLVLDRSIQPYLPVHHFKEIRSNGEVEHRLLHIPGPNEILAESALLTECAEHPKVFAWPEYVFSYRLNSANDRSGLFRHFTEGLQERQQAIARACEDYPNGVVRYTDIRRFYPSINPELAAQSWKRGAEAAGLRYEYLHLGERLLADYAHVGRELGHGVLTGPMFSHVIGNMVLREIDEAMASNRAVYYCRYVDDIVIVGSLGDVDQCTDELRIRLDDLGFKLHDDNSSKRMDVPVEEWLTARNDFRESRRPVSWVSLIGDLKRFLLLHPDQTETLREALRSAGFRIPVRDYSTAAHERGFVERVRELAMRHSWFGKRARLVDVPDIVRQATTLRETFQQECFSRLANIEQLNPFQRKRQIPKLRYRLGRLIYLAPDDMLVRLANAAHEVEELHVLVQVMRSVATGILDEMIYLGMDAAQSTGQALRAAGKQGKMATSGTLPPLMEKALAVVLLNGVPVEANLSYNDELSWLAQLGGDARLMRSTQGVIRELACLHGYAEQARHAVMLESAFDVDEDLILDAIDQCQYSS